MISTIKISNFFFIILISLYSKIKTECNSNEIEISSTKCIKYNLILEKNVVLTNDEVEIIYSNYKNKITKLSDVYFEISTITELKDPINERDKTVSTINVTKSCYQQLVGTTSTKNMYIFKFDFLTSNTFFNEVQFVLFYNGEIITNPICTSSPIIITYPIKIDKLSLSKTQISRMNLVINNDYDPFNKNSRFFTDVCSQFTSEDNTDVPLDDRKEDYYIKLNVCNSENENSIYDNYISKNNNNELYIQCAYGAFETDEAKEEAIDIIENELEKSSIVFS